MFLHRNWYHSACARQMAAGRHELARACFEDCRSAMRSCDPTCEQMQKLEEVLDCNKLGDNENCQCLPNCGHHHHLCISVPQDDNNITDLSCVDHKNQNRFNPDQSEATMLMVSNGINKSPMLPNEQREDLRSVMFNIETELEWNQSQCMGNIHPS